MAIRVLRRDRAEKENRTEPIPMVTEACYFMKIYVILYALPVSLVLGCQTLLSVVSSTGIEHVVNRVVYCATGTEIYISAG
jgi:hypothetical protein